MPPITQNGKSNGTSARESPSSLLNARQEYIDLATRLENSPALRRSEAYLAATQRLTRTGSWAASPGAEHGTFWSEETFRIFERPSSEGPLDRHELRELIHPDDRESHDRTVSEGVSAHRDWFVQFRIVLPGDRVKHLHVIGHPILDDGGDVTEWIGAIVDVTERMRAQEDLAQSQRELRKAVESIPVMAWMAHPDGTNAFVNRRCADYVGLQENQPSFDAWPDVVHPDDLARCIENWSRCVATGTPFEEEFRLRRAADGEYRWFLDRGVPLMGNDGRVVKWYGALTDIHDRKQAESVLAAERSRLAGEIHDTLAQGLAMIVMQVADVETKLGASWELAAKPLSTIRELAVESLAYARRTLNALRVPSTTAGLEEVVKEIVDRLGRHFEGALSLSVVGDATRIDSAVESALAGIAREALTNAVKHSSAIRVVTELEFMQDGAVRLVVSDDGVGFDANTVRADAYGLVSMQERASRAGVALTFVTEQGAGTTIVASWSADVRSS